jgi:hypothetical protein
VKWLSVAGDNTLICTNLSVPDVVLAEDGLHLSKYLMRPCPGNQKKSAEAKTATIIT